MKKVLTFFASFWLTLFSLSAQSIKIGAIVPLTGPLAIYGKGISQAIIQAVEEVNAQGGVNGKKVILVMEDDSAKPENTVAAFKKFVIKDKVIGIVGSQTSSTTLSITALAQSSRIPLVVPTSTHSEITTAGNFIFRICYTDSFQGRTLADFGRKQLQAQTAAVLFDKGNDYSAGLKSSFEKAFISAGGKVVAESYASSDKDFNAQISKIKQASPDVIFLPDYYNTVILLAKQIRASGLAVPLLGPDSWSSIIEADISELAGSFYADHFSPETTPRAKSFLESYQKRWKQTCGSLEALNYDATWILLNSIAVADRSGKLEGQSIRDALAAQKGEFVTGSISFDARRTATKSLVIMEIVKNAQGRLVTKYKTTINP